MWRSWWCLAVVLLVACGDLGDAAQGESTTLRSSTTPSTTASPAAAPTTGSTTTSTTADDSASSAVAPIEQTDARCRRIAELDSDEELMRWRVVNDGVMGGRSSARTVVNASVLTMEGEIVTDGGGFSSIRLRLDEPIGDASVLRLRIRTDGRPYELTASDATPGQDGRISHQGVIPAVGGAVWEEVDVTLATMKSSIFGQPVSADPFDPTTAVEIGIILADGTDGSFRFELDWISACP